MMAKGLNRLKRTVRVLLGGVMKCLEYFYVILANQLGDLL